MYLDCCLLTTSLFTVSSPSLCSLPTAFDFHTYALFRKPLPPFVSALFREPMHSLSRFYVLFRGPVLTLLPPSFGTVLSSSGDHYQPYIHPASGGVCINIISPSSGGLHLYFRPLLGHISTLFRGFPMTLFPLSSRSLH